MTPRVSFPTGPRIVFAAIFALLFSVVVFAPGSARAGDDEKPFLHALFTDHVVLQRERPIPVWGWTQPGARVTVSLGGKSASAIAGADGKWMAKLPSFPAGGPYEMTVAGPTTVKLQDVLIGDVWLCSGQSNMEMGVRIANDPDLEVTNADHPFIRLFTVPHKISYHPVETVNSQWQVCSPETVGKGGWGGFSAVGYFFGRDLQEDIHVPVGLIHSSWGGTIAEAWTSYEKLLLLPDFVGPVDKARDLDAAGGATNKNPNVVTVLYNGMIAPLVPYAIKGAIWYQGESNAGRARQYQRLLPTMINDWRERFGVGNFPFMIVQLANFMATKPQPAESAWAELREAQVIAAERAGNAGVALAIDIGDAKDIHPKNKQELGRRLSLAARAIAYHESIPYSGPVFRSAKIKGSHITVRFSHADDGLAAKGGSRVFGFAVAGADKKFEWANAVIHGDSVVVSAPFVANPVYVRYDWADNPQGNLYNGAGLPAVPFRTDEDY